MPIKYLLSFGLVLFTTFSGHAQSESCASLANANYDYLNEAIDAYNRGARRFNDEDYGSAEQSYRTAGDRAKFAHDMWDRLSEHVYCYDQSNLTRSDVREALRTARDIQKDSSCMSYVTSGFEIAQKVKENKGSLYQDEVNQKLSRVEGYVEESRKRCDENKREQIRELSALAALLHGSGKFRRTAAHDEIDALNKTTEEMAASLLKTAWASKLGFTHSDEGCYVEIGYRQNVDGKRYNWQIEIDMTQGPLATDIQVKQDRFLFVLSPETFNEDQVSAWYRIDRGEVTDIVPNADSSLDFYVADPHDFVTQLRKLNTLCSKRANLRASL